MIAFYLLGVIAVWATLTLLIWKAWRRVRKGAANPLGMDIAFAVVALVWLATSFWYGGGRKYYYDAEVERLCGVDGGIKVYETVRLSAEWFDSSGNVRIPFKQYARPNDEYFIETETVILQEGDPRLVRMNARVIRQSDGRILGESTRYGRGGGDLPGPWNSSSFTCPSPTDKPYLEPSIFKKEGETR